MTGRDGTDAGGSGGERRSRGIRAGGRRPDSASGSDADPDDVTVATAAPSDPNIEADRPGTLLGRYVVIEHVGSGGMGSVSRAYDPRLRREVAVKRLRATQRDAQAHGRLMREARAMARLSHPNVVAIYDVEEQGDAVYLAMEYVAGTTLRGWLDERERAFSRIVDVLRLAGQGLAAAHRAELVHRDFKPTNVLVADIAAEDPLGPWPVGAVKVTDFGLAKPATSSDLGQSSGREESQDELLTRAGTVMGTPRYMAPEQHHGTEAEARADQYAYCVTLWEALCGKAPFSGKNLEALAQAKMAGPPAWPRKDVPRSLGAALRRGLAPDPTDRWPSMDALLVALDRWRGQARRRRASWILGGVAIVTAGGFGLQGVQRRRIETACVTEGSAAAAVWPAMRDAVHRGLQDSDLPYALTTRDKIDPLLERWSEEWATARVELCLATELRKELSPDDGTKAIACLEQSRVRTETLLDSLKRGDRSAIQAAVGALSTPADLELCADPASIRQTLWPSVDELDEVVALRERLARASALQLAGLYEEAQQHAEAVKSAAEQLSFLPLKAEAQLRLGMVLELRGEYEAAHTHLKAAYFEAAKQGMDRVALEAATRLVFTLGERLARAKEGLQWGAHAEVFAARLGQTDRLMHANLYNNLAAVHLVAGHHDEAGRLHERALHIREEVLGPEHPDVGTSLSNLGRVRSDSGQYDEAKSLYERALDIRRRSLGPSHPHVASTLDNLAGVLGALGHDEQAVTLYRQALPIWEQAMGPHHPNVAVCSSGLAVALMRLERIDEALDAAQSALEIRDKALGPDHPSVAASLDIVATLRWRAGDRAEAKAMRERSLSIREEAYGADHPHVAISLNNLANFERVGGELDAAFEHYTRAVRIWERSEGTRHRLYHPLHGLAQVALERGDAAAAVGYAEQALQILGEQQHAPAGHEGQTTFVLARAQWGDGQRAVARETAARARDVLDGSDEAAQAQAEIDEWIAQRSPTKPTVPK